MKTISEFILEYKCHKDFLLEESLIIGEETINESFKSKILKNLASKISDTLRDYNRQQKENAKISDQKYGGKHTPHIQNFSTIFGPVTYNYKSGLQGVKWSEIIDNDFKLYTEYNKELEESIKNSYKKTNGHVDFIITDMNDTPVYFIKCYGYNINNEPVKNGIYSFTTSYGTKGVYELQKKAYKFAQKPYNTHDVLIKVEALLKSGMFKIYALDITPDMIKNYDDMHSTRLQSQEGIVNYDKKSLDELRKKQQARYKVLVKEMKTKKAEENIEGVFDDIKKINDEVVELYKKVIDTPEYIDKFYDMGSLMAYVTYAYEQYYKYVKYSRKREKEILNAKENGVKNPENYGEFDREIAVNSLNNVKEYLNNVKRDIEKFKKEL